MACLWRIAISSMIPQDSPLCYDSSMRHLAVLFIHFMAVLARLLGPGGFRSIVAESLLLRHQLLVVNRSRQRSPNPIRHRWLLDFSKIRTRCGIRSTSAQTPNEIIRLFSS